MESNLFDGKRPAWTSVGTIFIFTMLGFVVVGPLVGLLLVLPFFDMDVVLLREKLLSPARHTAIKIPFFVIQGCATLVGLILFPLLYRKFFWQGQALFFQYRAGLWSSLLIVAAVVLLSVLPNSFFVEWNATLSFPDFLQGFESWARAKEQQAKEITTFLTTFNSFNEFLVAMLVVAVLPSIGEELVFRGMLQPELQRATGNAHVAILLSAVLFSAIHVQFFGFFPRLFLGMLFGYMYYWSGHIIIPMFAHFINNGFAITMVYLYQLGWVSFNVESSYSTPLLPVIFCAIVIFMLLLRFKNKEQGYSPFL